MSWNTTVPMPSSRCLGVNPPAYPNARIVHDKQFGRDGIVFDGMDQYITQIDSGAPLGVELRQGTARIAADSRVDSRSTEIAAP